MRFYLSVLFFISIASSIIAQTCCSGGVPVASNLGLPNSSSKTLQIALGYDLNVLETLKSGNETLDDDSRSRRTHSGIFELGYSITDDFSIDGFFAYVRQEREINQFGNVDFSTTSGIGDAVILFKYKLLGTDDGAYSFQIGLGPKLPLGASDRKNERGLSLNADLQPGSGALDLITWAQWSLSIPSRKSMSFSSTAIYSRKGVNNDYLGEQSYRFGNEIQLAIGISDRIFIKDKIFDPSLVLRYRNQQEDVLNDFNVPSTGGNWFFLSPSIAHWIHPDFSVEAAFSIPLRADITGIQVTPTYRFRTGLYYRLSFQNNASEDVYKISF